MKPAIDSMSPAERQIVVRMIAAVALTHALSEPEQDDRRHCDGVQKKDLSGAEDTVQVHLVEGPGL